MFGNIKNYAVYGVAAGIAMAAFQFSTPAAAFLADSSDVYNHPDGALTNAPTVVYGLRLDSFCGIAGICGGTITDDEKTFSVVNAQGESTVWLDWKKSDKNDASLVDYTTARIHGTLSFNDTNATVANKLWTVEYNLTDIQAISGLNPTQFSQEGAANGWRVTAANASGTLTRVSDNFSINLSGKADGSGYAFIFDDDGHRCNGTVIYSDPCDATLTNEMVARGWVLLNGYNDGKTNDWLVVTDPKVPQNPNTPVPEPGTLALFGLGLIGLGYSRRRKAVLKG